MGKKEMNSINKGKAFERQIAHYLSSITSKRWLRVPCSGATATTHGTEAFHGDVFCESEEYKDFTIECKSTSLLTINDLLSERSKFAKYLQQTVSEATGKWALFIKPDSCGIFIVADNLDTLRELKIGFDKPSIIITNRPDITGGCFMVKIR